ncbi:MAG: molybdopterin-dependent oxidoreductase [Thermoplasmata archaeon]
MSSRVPPGQIVTHSWPVLHAGSVPADLTRENWDLTVGGQVATSLRIDFPQLLRFPQKEEVVDLHCVTSWTKLGTRWKGVPFRSIADRVMPAPEAQFVIMECEQGFTTSLPYQALLEDDVLVAYQVDGQELPAEHGGPVRMLVPKRYFYKSAKWLRGLRFVAKDEPGFWEVRGYSNIADPWAQTRYEVDDVRLIHRMRKEALFHPVTAAPAPPKVS